MNVKSARVVKGLLPHYLSFEEKADNILFLAKVTRSPKCSRSNLGLSSTP
jgi:hypothetical protein